MEVKDIVREWLQTHGYDALWNGAMECGCPLDDLFICQSDGYGCEPGYNYVCKRCKNRVSYPEKQKSWFCNECGHRNKRGMKDNG